MSGTPLSRLMDQAYESARPVTVQLELTYKCNLLCSFCYNAPKDKTPLTTEEWIEALDTLQAAGAFKIILTGGEPFMHPGFFQIAEAVRARGLVLKAYTNAVPLARREVAERWAALSPFDTEISIHGADAATHERLTGVRGSFAKLLEALGHMQELGIKATLKTPITRLNQEQLQEIERLVGDYGYKVTFDTNIVPTDDGDTSTLTLAADRKFLVDFFLDQARRGARGLKPRPVDRMKHGCGVGRVVAAVDPYGEIFPCVAWRRSVGNIREIDDLATVWADSEKKNESLTLVRRAADEAPKMLAQHADGGFAAFCPASAEKETGHPLAYYDGAKSSAATKMEAFRRLEDERKNER